MKKALDGFINETQKNVTGIVKVKLYKGNIEIAGRNSPFSLYDMKLATYTKEDTFDHTAAEGFIKIYGLPSKIYNRVNKEKFAKVKKALKRKK